MVFDFIFISMSLAGLAVLWRNWLEDHPGWKKNLNKFGLSKALLCGSCFSYWLALAGVLLFDPLFGWQLSSQYGYLIHIFISWMALGWLVVFLRFIYVSIQELVSWQVHNLNDKHH